MTELPAGTSWLFCPADRPERFAKALAAADVVILDLEDGVGAADKASARQALADVASGLDPARVVVRVNPVGSPEHAADVELVTRSGFTRLMLAKTESAEQVTGLAGFAVIGLCETARGVLNAASIAAAPNCVGLMWGAEDLVADLGGFSSRDAAGAYRSVAIHARSQVLLAAGAARIAALDAVYLNIADLDGLRAESEDAVQSGFAAKVCIHPTQVAVVREAFSPTPEQADWARRVLAAAADERGVFTVDGRMVDEPVLRQARRLLR